MTTPDLTPQEQARLATLLANEPELPPLHKLAVLALHHWDDHPRIQGNGVPHARVMHMLKSAGLVVEKEDQVLILTEAGKQIWEKRHVRSTH